MKHSIPLFCLILSVLFLNVACAKKGTSAPSSTAASAAGTLTVTPTLALLAPSGTTSVAVTGGSGVYTSATATEGTLTLISAGLYLYTAPASSSNSYIQITVTDSAGLPGYAYLTLSTGATSTTPVTTCAGTYDITIDDLNAQLYLLGDTSTQVTGYIYMLQYYYPVIGTCSVGGSLSMTSIALNQQITGSVALNGDNKLQISNGNFVGLDTSNHSWSGLSRDVAKTAKTPASSCEGNYTATIGSNTGTMVLIDDGSNAIAGYLTLNGYYYTLAGTCYGAGGSISMQNLTTGSTYQGSINSSGVMSGTFTTSAGGPYNWSASK